MLKADGIGFSVNHYIYQNVISIESDGTSDGMCYIIYLDEKYFDNRQSCILDGYCG